MAFVFCSVCVGVRPRLWCEGNTLRCTRRTFYRLLRMCVPFLLSPRKIFSLATPVTTVRKPCFDRVFVVFGYALGAVISRMPHTMLADEFYEPCRPWHCSPFHFMHTPLTCSQYHVIRKFYSSLSHTERLILKTCSRTGLQRLPVHKFS